MARNTKSIESLATELKNKMSRQTEELKIGVVVAYDVASYPLSLGRLVAQKVVSFGLNSEVITIPAINERVRNFGTNSEVSSAYKHHIANFLEMILSEKHCDAVVYLPSGFNCTVGCLLASIRLNIPTLILPLGLSQKISGQNLLDVLSLPGLIATNKKSAFDLERAKQNFCETYGSGVELSTENLFYTVLEIMELIEMNSSTTSANSFLKEDEAAHVAQRIVELTKSRLPLGKMINKKSIANAQILSGVLGGSYSISNALAQLADEAQIDFGIEKILGLLEKCPVLFDTNKGAENYREFGGTKGIIKAMIEKKIVGGDYKTFSGKTLFDTTKDAENYKEFLTIVRDTSNVIMRGNLSGKFAVTKTINLTPDKTKIIADAIVFDSDEDASNAVLNNLINKGEVIVIKAKWAKNCPANVCKTPLALASVGKTHDNIIITNGLLEDSIKCMGIVCETQDIDTLDLTLTGDEIEIDFVRGKLNVNVSSRDLNKRQKNAEVSKKSLAKFFRKI